MPEELMLWLISASDNKAVSEIMHVYAEDESDAREQAREWFALRPQLPYHVVRAYPNGFQYSLTRLPGHPVQR